MEKLGAISKAIRGAVDLLQDASILLPNTQITTPTTILGQTRRIRTLSGAAARAAAACLLLTVMVVAVGCGGVHFERSEAGYYPPETNYTTNWKYEAFLYVETTDPGSMYTLQDKTVWIRVEDRDGNRLLDDRIKLRACLVEGEATWHTFDDLSIVLTETGFEYEGEYSKFNDSHSVALSKSGPQQLTTLKYRYNDKRRRFEKVE